MITVIKEYSFEEAKDIVLNAINEDKVFLKQLYKVCDKFDSLIKNIIIQLEEENSECQLSEIDTINAIRINQVLPFYIIEEEHENMREFCQAYILILQNFINFTGENNKIIEPSVQVIGKLLQTEQSFSRLIYLSELLLNKYESVAQDVNRLESYKISKLYIDKILKQSNETQD